MHRHTKLCIRSVRMSNNIPIWSVWQTHRPNHLFSSHVNRLKQKLQVNTASLVTAPH